MRILITGTAGFIGYHLVNKLAKGGHQLLGVDAINDYYDVNLKFDRLKESGINRYGAESGKIVKSKTHDNYHFIRLNIEDIEALKSQFKSFKPEIVINLAAQAGVRYSLTHPEKYIHSNIVGFANILELCRKHEIKNLVYASSSSVYGLNTSQPFSVHHNVDHPISLYAASKKSNELMAHTYSHLFGIPTTGLRFFTVYGPWGRPDMALFMFTKAILAGEPIEVYNNGNMQRDFTYIDDIILGMKKVIDNPARPNSDWTGSAPDPGSSPAPYRIYNMGRSSPIKLMDFIAELEQSIGITAEKIFMPIQPGDVPSTFADVSDLMEEYDYRPKTDISRGIKNFVSWYRNYYNV